MSQTGQQIIKIHILSNISRSTCNQEMKFGQLIEYNIFTLIFYKRVWDWFLRHILCINFQGKYFLYFILLT